MTALGGLLPRPLAVLLIVLAALTGCGGGDGGPAQAAFESDLEDLPAVADARVERKAFDTEYFGEEVVVDMSADATPEQVTVVLDTLKQRRRHPDGKPQDARVTMGAGHTDTIGDDFQPDAAPQLAVDAQSRTTNARMAGWFVDAVRALPGRNVIVVGNRWDVFAAAEGDDPRQAVKAAAEAILRNDRLAAIGNLVVTGFSGTGADQRKATMGVSRGLTQEALARWTKAARALDDDLVRNFSSYGIGAWLDLRLPGDVKPRQLTTAKYGNQLWPIIRTQLDLLAAAERRATLTVINHYDYRQDGSHLEDRFLEVTTGKPARRDRHGRTWNAEATAYLDQVLATRSAR